MAISLVTRPPSHQQQYDAFFRGDPAFVQGAGPEYEAKLARARETGDWSQMLIAGLVPTKFVLRQIPGKIKRRILDQHTAGKIGDRELDALLVRLAVVDVVNLGDFKLRPSIDEQWGALAHEDLIDLLDDVAPGAVADLALQIFERMMGLSGKS